MNQIRQECLVLGSHLTLELSDDAGGFNGVSIKFCSNPRLVRNLPIAGQRFPGSQARLSVPIGLPLPNVQVALEVPASREFL